VVAGLLKTLERLAGLAALEALDQLGEVPVPLGAAPDPLTLSRPLPRVWSAIRTAFEMPATSVAP
ncbi:hypothetical protein ABZ281_49735, partial [Streptomyces sp. NPDC006265]|uniref:hypothetical protein n=1 Tax=Streptomyces sp. NPDC006265 TaxID=3156740 RepID=UPI0033BC510C